MKKGPHVVRIHFEDEQKAKDFLRWLCNSGEQEYFQQEQYGNIKVVEAFDYLFPQDERFPRNDPRRFKGSKFGGEDGLTAVAVDPIEDGEN